MGKNVLVFDFGASNARAMLISFENGSFILKEVHRFENTPIFKNKNIHWDISYLFEEIQTALSVAVFMGGYDAISIDTWGVDFGLIDAKGELMSDPFHYRDNRTFNMPEKLRESLSDFEIFQKTGVQPMRINTIYQLLSLKHNDENTLFKAEKLLLMPDLFAYLLTGIIRSEYTMATTTQLVNPLTNDWNYELIEMLELPKRIFPEMIYPGEEYGLLKPDLANSLKIPQVPVIATAGHDTASAVIAIPAESEKFLYISCGTWTLFGTELEKPILTKEAFESGFSNEGGINKTTTFVKNIMGLWLIQETRRHYLNKGETYSYGELESLARKAESLKCFINPNDDLFSTPQNMPLKIQDYCKKTDQFIPQTIGEIMRCIYDSLAMEFLNSYTNLAEVTGNKFPTIHMIGGGTRDSLLCQSTANALGITVYAGPTEATAMGNAVSTLVNLGELENISIARKTLSKSDEIKKYLPENNEIWAEKYQDYSTIINYKKVD